MQRFYVEKSQIEEKFITIIGSDVNHIRNVLRMRVGEKIIISDGQGKDFYCIIDSECADRVVACIEEAKDSDTELKGKIYLFQGIPKKDKMELIIQKSVELGVHEIIPVMTKRTVVKLEDKKKEQKKLERWQAISESGAKQSGRGIIPVIKNTMSFKEALNYCKEMDISIIPYENADSSADGIKRTRELIGGVKSTNSVAIFIGPEGGFSEEEIELAIKANLIPVSLGRRILRTETAGLAIISMIMIQMEE